MIFMSFVATKLVRLLTTKSTKGLKVTLILPWARKIEGSHFFMPFMVSRSHRTDLFARGRKCQPIAKLDSLARPERLDSTFPFRQASIASILDAGLRVHTITILECILQFITNSSDGSDRGQASE